jgi:hypothetical protein
MAYPLGLRRGLADTMRAIGPPAKSNLDKALLSEEHCGLPRRRYSQDGTIDAADNSLGRVAEQ